MFLKGALICLLAFWIEIDAAKKGKFLKKLAKPNELGYQLENAVKSNLKDEVSSNNASITTNEEDISNLQDRFDSLQADNNASITSNDEDISILQGKFDSLQADNNASITSNDEDISILQGKFDTLQAEYNASTTTNQEDISTLMDRLDSLQSDYISLRADYNVLKAGIQTNGDKIHEGILANTNLNNTLADVASNIANNAADIHDNAWSIANNTVDISNNKVDVADNLADITKNAMDIASHLSSHELGCYDYKILNENQRNHQVKSPSGSYWSDTTGCSYTNSQWYGDDWYRFLSPAGTRIAEEAPGHQYCGTSATGWMQGSHPTILGEIVTRTVCFQSSSNTCYYSSEIKVRNCGQFFLYRLADTPQCHLGYCAK